MLETEYADANANAAETHQLTMRSGVQSRFDDDFDYGEEEVANELDRYITEKPAGREIKVLLWWKVNKIYFL